MTPKSTKPVQLLTIQQVAGLLNCSTDHVYDLIAEGAFGDLVDISSAKSSRAKTRITETGFAAYLAARTRPVATTRRRA